MNNMNKAYQQISIFDLLNEDKPKKIDLNIVKEYIKKRFFDDNMPYIDFVYNIILCDFYSNMWCRYTGSLNEDYDFFKDIYLTFEKIFSNEKILIFRLCGFVYIRLFNDFIVKLCSSSTGLLCAPACSITWYNFDGTFTNDFMRLNDNEFITSEIKLYGTSKQEKEYNFNYVRSDRRNYYFFNLLGIHKYGRYRKGLEDLVIDSFVRYEFDLKDLINYFSN